MMQQALPLGDGDHIDPHYLHEVQTRAARGEPPISAEEYLLRVRLEFAALPDVMEATHIDPRAYDSHQTAYMPSQPSLPPTPAELAPSVEWEEDVLANFYEVRESLTTLEEVGVGKDRKIKVPPLREEGSWRVFFFGRKERGERGGVGRGRKRKKVGGEEDEKEMVVEGRNGEERGNEEEGDEMKEEREKEKFPEVPPTPTATVAPEGEGLEGGIETAAPAATDGPTASSQPHPSSLPPSLAALISPPPPSLPALPKPAPAVAVAAPPVVYEGPTPPLTSLVLQFDQVCTVRLLAYHAQWFDSSSSLKYAQGAWLFALLARLSQPLHPEAAALVRQIYRRCYLLRAHFPLPNPAAEAGEGREEEERGIEGEDEGPVAVLGRLNTLIAITGTFFEQAEGEGAENRDVVEGVENEQDEAEQQQQQQAQPQQQTQQQQQQPPERVETKGEELDIGEVEEGRQAEEEEREDGEVEEGETQ
ncbi:hypothetical protein VYU27_007947 [Nannochloropsis oceanica]